MTLWPRSLLSRLLVIVLAGLLLANTLSLTLVMVERMHSARTVMLGNLENDVATSVAILDRLPAQERAAWLPRLERGNYRYILGPGEPGAPPEDKRSRDAIRTLKETLTADYPLTFTAVPGPISHIQAHLTLRDGAPLTIDLTPRMPPVASWLPVVLVLQLLLLAACAWIAVRQVIRPFSQFTRAVDALDPAANTPMTEKGPVEVQRAAHAFNAMQARIQSYLRERAQILASISHDLQTPITRMKLRVEMADQPELRDKLLNDLDNMTRLVREGIAYARSSESLEETSVKLELNAWVNSIACDYQDIGKNVQFQANDARLPIVTRPQALRRVMTNLLDNALKFGGYAVIEIDGSFAGHIAIHILDGGPGIPEAELDAVLQPFYRVETSRNRDTGGTGLGLAIAAQLTAQLDGKLRLANLPEGGLKVTVTLPRR
ncbi:histidine kinase [Enterobacter ludwigii]|uniref:ATP-binding protein n=1 Tax=Enterobacter TaxID=547 RepID=UPI000A37F720|nr:MULTISPECIES: ATP-binding protein [Enterobacter]ELK6308200.1 HAMP domain-containing protein [Enterobacter ludwigii]ELK6457253.1 HAMP domain-containing protein [Enterobacter ludwigii]MCE1610206.1 ATP-binding protein [Enterobacter ludwigii]MCE1623502.1 ATP-binding protein [Enterobacter ludwigii]OUF17146.1 histidine kinase [Enterobacter ludwigii]